MIRRTVAAIALIFFTAAGAAACSASGGAGKGNEAVAAEIGDLVVTVNGTGNVELTGDRKLTFGGAGRIVEIAVKKGDRVLKGATLARLDTSALELAVIKAEDGLMRAERALKDVKAPYDDVDRAVALSVLAAAEAGLTGAYQAWAVEQSSTAKWSAVKGAEAELERARDNMRKIEEGAKAEDVADAERQVAIARATLDDIKRQLRDMTIFAPFDGLVAGVDAHTGESVTPAVAILRLIDPASKELRVEVDEIDMPLVKLGQKAVVEVEAFPDVQFEGKVTYINPVSVEAFGVVAYEVTLDVKARDGAELMDGMSATARIVVAERRNALLVPTRAISRDGQGKTLVQVLDGKKTEDRSVVLGETNGSRTEILEGIKAGEKVVVKG